MFGVRTDVTGIGRTAEIGRGEPPAPDPEGLAPPAEGVDPELIGLPAPPRGRRLAVMTLMALVAAAAFGLLASLGPDLRYALSSPTATDVGDVTSVEPASLVANSYVRVGGTPMAAHGVRYSTLWGEGSYVVAPLAGQRDVLVRIPLGDMEALRTSSRREFAGRLMTLGQLGSAFAPVRQQLDDMGVPVSSETFVLLVDETPGQLGWPLFVGALCLLFIAVDVVLMVRWFRPLRT